MADSNDGEEGLVVRSRGGDRAAFELLVRRTARGLFAKFYLQTADAHQAEDLVQETFLRAWKKIDSISDAKAFRGWLNSIANGVLVDAAKRDSRKKRGRERDRTDLQLIEDGSPPPDQSAQTNEERRQVLELLRNLPGEYRDVLTLRYLTGADYATISKQLAISNGSLRGLLHRGMKILKDKMEKPQMNTDEHG